MARLYWKPQGFEYKAYVPFQDTDVTEEQVDEHLAELGAAGWEMVTAIAHRLGITYFFKRPLPPPGLEMR
ncbi:hypothetical protein [Devosia sp.]|uniref:hypothetical protein n=1 Tax=Devosia sp. TaxID=1871048 RepID=UPI00273290C2|nr:hypothetical protein [Devosia sp.]MDP2779761.1 hypothetical protein [Devosia sp.]